MPKGSGKEMPTPVVSLGLSSKEHSVRGGTEPSQTPVYVVFHVCWEIGLGYLLKLEAIVIFMGC